jgi:hypothetical protein
MKNPAKCGVFPFLRKNLYKHNFEEYKRERNVTEHDGGCYESGALAIYHFWSSLVDS